MFEVNKPNVLDLCSKLKDVCHNNEEYFSSDKSSVGKQLYDTLTRILEELETVTNLVGEVDSFAHEYDFDVDVPGNGYRSFVHVTTCCLQNMLTISNKLFDSRNSFWFSKSWYAREFEWYEALLISVRSCLKYLLLLREWSDEGDLFPSKVNSARELFGLEEPIYQACFYGRCLGFQYCSSIQKILHFISSCMAGFSELHFTKSHFIIGTIRSIVLGGVCMLSPAMRAVRIVDLMKDTDVGFCKEFWLLAEGKFMQFYSSVASATVAVNRTIIIPPQALTVDPVNGGYAIDVPVPTSHYGPQSISTRLISLKKRKGMLGVNIGDSDVHPPSDAIMIHCHGGGFIAQSSMSHQVYTRSWAAELDVPILSIDYSLSPGAPYPRAFEEVFYMYCWVLQNCSLLGSTGKIIILAGDSAGSNLNFGTTLKCLQNGIRKPDGLFIAYCPFYVKFAPSPARLLCLMDPLLPFGFMMRCLKAYVVPVDSVTKQNEERLKLMQRIINSAYSSKIRNEIVENGRKPDTQNLEENFKPKIVKPSKNSTRGIANILTEGLVNLLSRPHCLTSSSFFTKSTIGANVSDDTSNSAKKQWTKSTRDIKSILFEDPTKEFDFEVPSDQFISPYLADAEVLKLLPNIKILSVEMDPCLDDCVMLAKKLKKLGVDVTLDILGGLPHGFLNLVKVSKEADEGSERCVKLLRSLLQDARTKYVS